MRARHRLKVVILETDHIRRDYLKSAVSEDGYGLFCFETVSICLDNLAPLNPDLVISGSLPAQRSFSFINCIQLIDETLPVLMVSDVDDLQYFLEINGFKQVHIIKAASKPVDIRRAARAILQQGHASNAGYHNAPLIIGNSPEMVKLKRRIADLALCNDAVLIQGEVGTGKALVAKAIHCRAKMHGDTFVRIRSDVLAANLNGRPEHTGYTGGVESVLKAYRAGRKGIPLCTIFLDEVADLPMSSQGLLLQFTDDTVTGIEDKRRGAFLNFRIIASTGADLDALVEKGVFRKDLYHRLNVFSIRIPPLRDRSEDIPLLVDFFTSKFCWKFGKSHYEMGPQAKKIFSEYRWPGNVNELEHLVKTAITLGNEDELASRLEIVNRENKSADFSAFFEDIYSMAGLEDLHCHIEDLSAISLKNVCSQYMVRIEKKLIKEALGYVNGNRKKAAAVLRISYKSLLNKIKTYKLA